jgi:hypothetical protein
MPAQISVSIRDSKAKTSHYFVNIPVATSLANATFFAQAVATLSDVLMGGQITSLGLCYRLDLPGGLKASPLANSDVEEGARFGFLTENLFSTRLRIPTFLEDYIVPGSKEVDLTDPDVDALVTLLVDGDIQNTEACDNREDDIESVAVARENFVKDRG